MDVNQIFKDLAMMIHDQGDMIGKCIWIVSFSWFSYMFCQHGLNFSVFCIKSIVILAKIFRNTEALKYFAMSSPVFSIDSIEANVESAEVHVERASEQLQRAAYYQVNSVCLLDCRCMVE